MLTGGGPVITFCGGLSPARCSGDMCICTSMLEMGDIVDHIGTGAYLTVSVSLPGVSGQHL